MQPIYKEIQRFRYPWLIVAINLVWVLAFSISIFEGKPNIILLMGAGLVVSNIFLLTTKLRVTITEEQIHLKFGIFQDTISMEQIESFEVNKLSWWTYGIGYRLSPFTKTTAYIMEGSTQVKLHLTKGSVVVFSTKNSTACIHALQQLGLSMGMSFASAKGKST